MLQFIYNLILFVSKIFGFRNMATRPESVEKKSKSVYDIKLKTATGKELSLAEYKGKKILIVNTSSTCGFTPQLEELQKLHEQYNETVEVLGFPSDNFGLKESKENKKIEEFCQVNYGVTFRMFSKDNVKGEQSSELFNWLFTKEQNGWNDKSPNWNFCKYLINENGELVAYFSPAVSPLSKEVMQFLN